MRQLTANIYARVETNASGIVTVTYPTSSGSVMGTLLPTGGTIVQKQYGLEYAGEFEFYSKKSNAYLVAGNRLLIGSTYYNIIAIRDYSKVITCLLQKVVA